MLSVQHIMMTIVGKGFNIGYAMNNASHIVFLDAIRAYSKYRQISHFEQNADGTDTSYWHLPDNYKVLTEEYVQNHIKDWAHLAKDIKKCAVGEQSSIDTFELTNKHLPLSQFMGCKYHMIQDFVFDLFLRKYIDVTRRHEDIFVYNGQVYTGEQIRKIIDEIEQFAIYILAYFIKKYSGVLINQAWFDTNINRMLHRDYTDELADITMSFMKINDKIEALINAEDWSQLHNGPIPFEDYVDMFNTVGRMMGDIRFLVIKD